MVPMFILSLFNKTSPFLIHSNWKGRVPDLVEQMTAILSPTLVSVGNSNLEILGSAWEKEWALYPHRKISTYNKRWTRWIGKASEQKASFWLSQLRSKSIVCLLKGLKAPHFDWRPRTGPLAGKSSSQHALWLVLYLTLEDGIHSQRLVASRCRLCTCKSLHPIWIHFQEIDLLSENELASIHHLWWKGIIEKEPEEWKTGRAINKCHTLSLRDGNHWFWFSSGQALNNYFRPFSNTNFTWWLDDPFRWCCN